MDGLRNTAYGPSSNPNLKHTPLKLPSIYGSIWNSPTGTTVWSRPQKLAMAITVQPIVWNSRIIHGGRRRAAPHPARPFYVYLGIPRDPSNKT